MKYNPIEKFDDGVMWTINQGVKKWNWATGGTKADLADFLGGVSTVGTGVGTSIGSNPFIGIIVGVGVGCVQYVSSNLNYLFEEREINELTTGAKRFDIEMKKWAYKRVGYSEGGIGTNFALISLIQRDNLEMVGGIMVGVSAATMGVQKLVMLADNHPRQKNCVKRGLEWVAEKYQNSKLVPVRVGSHYEAP